MHLGEEAALADFVRVFEIGRRGIRVLGGPVTDDEKGAGRLWRDGHAPNLAGVGRNARPGVVGIWELQIGRSVSDCGVLFQKLQLWVDEEKRPGPEAMAVDEWLLETVVCPVLRVYPWEGTWGSLGYFGKIAEARELFPELSWVRRWTGGGLVDHRSDWTYTLVVPSGESLATTRGADSYQMIHEILMEVLQLERIEARISDGNQTTGANACFENPVAHDLLGQGGRKLAGAGQRRSKTGLLHQGSVASPCGGAGENLQRAECFAAHLGSSWESFAGEPSRTDLERRVVARYARSEWLERR